VIIKGVWWLEPGWPLGAQPAVLSLSLLSRMQGENKMKMPSGPGKDRETTHQLPSQVKQNQCGEDWFNLL